MADDKTRDFNLALQQDEEDKTGKVKISQKIPDERTGKITTTGTGKLVPRSATDIVRRALGTETKLGEILISQTSLTEPQLQDALAIQKEKGGRLGDILVQKKYLQP